MTQNVYDLLWFFLFYSFLGWVIGTVAAAMRKHRFVDVGFLYGPWCASYGIGGLMIAIFLQDLRNQLFFLFLGGAILSFLVSLATGFLLERIFHRKWWDYSREALPVRRICQPSLRGCVGRCRRGLHLLCESGAPALVPSDSPHSWRNYPLDPSRNHASRLYRNGHGCSGRKIRLKKATLLGVLSENLQNTADLFGEGLTGLVLRHLGNASSELEAKKLLEARQARERELENCQSQIRHIRRGLLFL